jgi:hypothetical protein
MTPTVSLGLLALAGGGATSVVLVPTADEPDRPAFGTFAAREVATLLGE